MVLKKKHLLLIFLLATMVFVLYITGCVPKTVDSESRGDEGITADASDMAIDWSPESNCASCHSSEAGSLSNAATAAGIHSAQRLNCISCHTDADGTLMKVHEKVEAGQTTAKSLRRTAVASETCTVSGCHDDPALRVKATDGLDAFQDSNGLVVNPHELPDTKEHTSINCSNCHSGHAPMQDDKLMLACTSCHHAGVFECGTCHD